MDVDKALEATFEGAPPHPDGPAGVEPAGNAVQPEETPNTRELISRAGKIFLGGLGEPVASGDGRAVQETTNSLLIDVVDAMRELFTTSKKEIAASCGGLTELQARGYLLADLLGRFDLVYDNHADEAGRRAGTQAKARRWRKRQEMPRTRGGPRR